MINKIEVRKSFDRYSITYSVDGDISFTDILRSCKNSIRSIWIKEDADIGLSSYGGSYTFDELDKKFDLNYLFFDEMYVFFKNDDTCLRYKGFEDELSVTTQDPNFDLEAFGNWQMKLKVLGSVSPY